MSVVEEVLSDLERAFAHREPPRVRALHLPPAPWTGNKDGEFAALELADGSLGLGYVLLEDTLGRLASGALARETAGTDALALARAWADRDPARRTVGFAAVNALTRHLFDRAGFVPPAAPDSIAGLDPQRGEHIGMIGFFRPLVKEVIARGARLTVLELKADLAGEREGYRVSLDPRDLATCDKVLSTSTVLLNDTLDRVVEACQKARTFALIGPGASCLPDALFRRGVTIMGGTWVIEPAPFKEALAAGAPWGIHASKFALPRADYPGVDALRARGS